MNAYLACWKKFAVFTGRSSRNEFWSWWLINLAIMIVYQIIFNAVGGFGSIDFDAQGQIQTTPMTSAGMAVSAIGGLYGLLSLLPTIGVFIRRLHDQDRSGLWLLLIFTCIGYLIVLVMQVLPGTEGDNRFGAQPAS
jgi:uncharacterized membrane protein YhaH (DUF805 family)